MMILITVLVGICIAKDIYIVFFDQDPHMDKVSAAGIYAESMLGIQSLLGDDESIDTKMVNGFVAQMNESTAEKVKMYPGVKMVVRDSAVGISELKVSEEPDDAEPKEQIMTQRHAPWGLIRIGGGTSLANGSFYYPANSGRKVDVYVLDTGVETNHPEFEDRARWGSNFVPESPDEDEHGHGTHCAGIIAGNNFGIAKKANIIGVKVLDKNGFGMTSRLLQGVDFVIREHEKKKDDVYRQLADQYLESTESDDSGIMDIDFSESVSDLRSIKVPKPSLSQLIDMASNESLVPKTVVNLSVGGSRNAALNFAVEYASKLGIHFSTAAGNEHEDACEFSPGSSKASITTGASTFRDTVAFFSNFGKCVNIFAPGVDILSSWIGGKQKIASGTSMATPHTTGAMATYLTYYNYTPHALKQHLMRDAHNVIDSTVEDEYIPPVSGSLHLPSFLSPKKKLPMLSIVNLLRRISKQ
ncbi:S8 serine protease [Ordospora colligata]|uniref:S8 serine protease n=1 Tax=Ordospora colligata OC4 TaxID=1354746 RepID=A0A0B2UN08_9MICR|nr:S8 serine protease [Ordospora colligata OC4]KHN70452.1 S8 serine protease [Ordospora colligata OC4]TBU17202.1 S8 serine protease [Ordospora colligata]TBU17452.1 S8 serine protease [Ordospora colligata]TBU19632.1 S8 serine protease [Ordospora colligata]